MAFESADGWMARFSERVAAAPVLELLASPGPQAACFRFRCEETEGVNPNLSAALRACGHASISDVQIGGRAAIRCEIDIPAIDRGADALVNAAIVLGLVAANGRPVPESVTGYLLQDGLPAYIGFAGLWRLELSGIEISILGPLLEARLKREPENACAMMDIATLLMLTLIPGNRAPALGKQAWALDRQQMYRLPARRTGPVLRVLAIAGPGDMTAITHLDCLLEDSDIELLMLYVWPGRSLPDPLPQHDLVFVAIGESGPNRPLLERIVPLARASARPVLNRPERILGLSRDRVSALLRPVAGVDMPLTVSVAREALQKLAQGELPIEQLLEDGCFPIILRPVDSQGGKDLARLDDPASVAAYLGTTAATTCYVSRFVDYSGADGLFRKYRVAFIEGRPYACHMAVSTHWMVHYVNADMDDSAEKRTEEARFMAGFDTGFGLRHAHGLAQIDRLLGLDYYGIDCAETADGKLLVFEADTAMLVHAMDRADLYPYKRPQMEKLFGAFRRMLGKAKDSPSPPVAR
jgi:glutathione synthase/RimK-type ligase-like ATP-grasp enzyme